MTKPTDAQIAAAIHASRHFQLVAHGRISGVNSVAAFRRDAQLLADALAAMGFVGKI
jgi:hypothetical protein